jgi:hypothetical protein
MELRTLYIAKWDVSALVISLRSFFVGFYGRFLKRCQDVNAVGHWFFLKAPQWNDMVENSQNAFVDGQTPNQYSMPNSFLSGQLKSAIP